MSSGSLGSGEPRASAASSSSSTESLRTSEGEFELVVCWGDELRCVPLPTQGQVTLGRAEGNVIRLDYPAGSRHHAVLHLGPQLRIEDLGCANGTFVRDSKRASPRDETANLLQLVGKSAEIALGDAIVVGAITLVLRRRAPTEPTSAQDTAEERSLPIVRSPLVQDVYSQAERAAQ